MTPQEELELLSELYVESNPYDTFDNISKRMGELLNIVKPLPKTFETEIPGNYLLNINFTN